MNGDDFARSLPEGLSKNRYIWVGLLLAVLNWFVESAHHVWVFKEGNYREQVFTTDIHEIWMRLLVGMFFVVFGLSTQRAFNLRQRHERALETGERKYRTLIEEALNPIFVFGPSGRIQDINLAAQQFFDIGRDQLLTRGIRI